MQISKSKRSYRLLGSGMNIVIRSEERVFPTPLPKKTFQALEGLFCCLCLHKCLCSCINSIMRKVPSFRERMPEVEEVLFSHRQKQIEAAAKVVTRRELTMEISRLKRPLQEVIVNQLRSDSEEVANQLKANGLRPRNGRYWEITRVKRGYSINTPASHPRQEGMPTRSSFTVVFGLGVTQDGEMIKYQRSSDAPNHHDIHIARDRDIFPQSCITEDGQRYDEALLTNLQTRLAELLLVNSDSKPI